MNGRRSRAQRGLKYRGRLSWAVRSGERVCAASHAELDTEACPSCGAAR